MTAPRDLRPVWVGREMFAIPRRARVVWPSGERVAVVLFEGIVWLLMETGEMEVPLDRQRILREHYFPEKKIPTG